MIACLEEMEEGHQVQWIPSSVASYFIWVVGHASSICLMHWTKKSNLWLQSLICNRTHCSMCHNTILSWPSSYLSSICATVNLILVCARHDSFHWHLALTNLSCLNTHLVVHGPSLLRPHLVGTQPNWVWAPDKPRHLRKSLIQLSGHNDSTLVKVTQIFIPDQFFCLIKNIVFTRWFTLFTSHGGGHNVLDHWCLISWYCFTLTAHIWYLYNALVEYSVQIHNSFLMHL